MKKEKTAAERRKELAIMWSCRAYLYCHDMLTLAEYDKLGRRMCAFQNEHQINITNKQIESVEIKYSEKP